MNKTDVSSNYLKVDIDNNLEAIGLSQNYSVLLSKLEKLAFGDQSPSKITPELHRVLAGDFQPHQHQISDIFVTEDTTVIHTITDAEYSRFISDVWIGIVLTLLILSIIFFICSCFLYHKFQQWKNSYRTNNSEPEIIRRYDIDVESLPSYTLVSGLPTYDDALEQFRKAGILIQQPSVIKIFEDVSSTIKTPLTENEISTNENNMNSLNTEEINHDNISINSCNCGAGSSVSSSAGNTSLTTAPSTSHSATTLSTLASVIELTPQQLRILSQKRLSLQITFNNNGSNAYGGGGSGSNSSSLRLNRNIGRIDLCREVNRNNLLKSHEFPRIHRSTTSLNNERSILARRLMRNSQHRGSLS